MVVDFFFFYYCVYCVAFLFMRKFYYLFYIVRFRWCTTYSNGDGKVYRTRATLIINHFCRAEFRWGWSQNHNPNKKSTTNCGESTWTEKWTISSILQLVLISSCVTKWELFSVLHCRRQVLELRTRLQIVRVFYSFFLLSSRIGVCLWIVEKYFIKFCLILIWKQSNSDDGWREVVVTVAAAMTTK